MSSIRNRKSPGVIAAFFIVLLAAAWIYFAPAKLGGQANYVIVTGNSMEPLFHQGDLVFIRYSDQVNIGDIFAYRYPKLGQVIHRVVGREGERFIFKGDNNAWTDGFKPSAEDLIGKAIFHLDGAGKWVLWLRNPFRFAGLVALLSGLIVFGVVLDSSPNKGKKMKISQILQGIKVPRIPPFIAREREGYLFALAILFFASIALGIYAFVSPLTITVEDNIEYINSAEFSYTTHSSPRVYNKGVVVSGDPVFTQLNCILKIDTEYSIQSTEHVDVSGSYKTRVLVSEPTGWNRTMILAEETPFQGNSVKMTSYLNVCAVQKMIQAANELAGLIRPFYTVSVITDMAASGSIGSRPYKELVSPSLDFSFDTNELYLIQDDQEQTNPLQWEQSGVILGEKETANELSIFGLKIPVLSARTIAIAGAFISIVGILLLTLPVYQKTQKDELAYIHMKYASQLVNISQSRAKRKTASTNLMEVSSMDDLARLAQSSDQFILEETVGDEHQFLVLSDPYTYRFTLKTPPVEPPKPETGEALEESTSAKTENGGNSGEKPVEGEKGNES